MLLEKKNAVFYGAAGSIGGAVARAFAGEGERIYLARQDAGGLRLTPRRQRKSAGARPPTSVRQVEADSQRA